jgi:hypothetical protein
MGSFADGAPVATRVHQSSFGISPRAVLRVPGESTAHDTTTALNHQIYRYRLVRTSSLGMVRIERVRVGALSTRVANRSPAPMDRKRPIAS